MTEKKPVSLLFLKFDMSYIYSIYYIVYKPSKMYMSDAIELSVSNKQLSFFRTLMYVFTILQVLVSICKF